MSRWIHAGRVAVSATLLLTGSTGARTGAASRLAPVAWRTIAPGVAFAERRVSAGGEGRWTRILLLRMDPARIGLRLEARLTPGLDRGDWTVDAAPRGALAAFNAGQFRDIAPWGWTVMDGLELRPPGVGPLSQAVVVDRAGTVRFVPPDSIAAARAAGGVVTAFQSYPSLLVGDGVIPRAITTAGHGVGITHRDARLALCQLRDGTLLLLLTRFDGLGEVGAGIPFGLTLAETATLLQAAGCRRAVALDGGISAQLAVREPEGWRRWPGWRRVPLGVVVEAR